MRFELQLAKGVGCKFIPALLAKGPEYVTLGMDMFEVQNTWVGGVESGPQTGSPHTLESDMSVGNWQALASKKTHTPLHSAIANVGGGWAWFGFQEGKRINTKAIVLEKTGWGGETWGSQSILSSWLSST